MEDEVIDVEYLEQENFKQIYIPKSFLSAGQVVNILRRMFNLINPYYIDLAERTAFCSIKLFDYIKMNNKANIDINRNELVLMSVLFTIGAYKDEFNDYLGKEDSIVKKDVKKIFLYSYLYLKHMTPLKEMAEAVLLYSTSYEKAKKSFSKYSEYASLIFTCMRICVQYRKTNYKDLSVVKESEFIQSIKKLYNPIYIDLFFEANLKNEITNEIEKGSYFKKLDEYCNSLVYNYEDSFLLLKMLIYSVDFISTSTVTHIINTAFHSTEICNLLDLTEGEQDEVFTAAVIHDIGKLSVDINILESAEQLSPKEMEIMRTHVNVGDEICREIVGDKICNIAFRHHETLDGTGYPNGIGEKDLTYQDRILAVGDILSALTDARTYKPSFSKEKTLEILSSLAEKNKLDKNLVLKVKDNYELIVENTKARRPMLTTNLGYVMVEYMLLKDCASMEELFKSIHYKE